MLYKSNLLAQASGSLDGTVFSHNRFGRYTRNRTIPVDPASARQQIVRTLFAAYAAAWSQTLTAAQRTAWNTYAANVPVINKLGDTVYLTGFNMYIGSNTPRSQAGIGGVLSGPTIFTLPEADTSFAVSASEATQLITVTFDDTRDWCDEDGGFMSVSCGNPQGGQIGYFGGPWRFADSIDGDSITPPTTTETVSAPYTISEGQIIWVRYRIAKDDGRISNWHTVATAVAA